MDVLDAGVYVSRWEARVPKNATMTLWGPLQAREMGLDGWEVQDGGETGFVLHTFGNHLRMGRGTATLIFARRLERAFLTVYLGGYPSDAAPQQRKLDSQAFVGACEVFLSRLAKEPVKFQLLGELALVDNGTAGKVVDAAPPSRQLGGGMRLARNPKLDGDDGEVEVVGKRKSDVWEV